MSIAKVNNGVELYYETHGTGAPVIVLHGGLGSVEMFGGNVAALAKSRQVIGVDLRAHGRTADVDRPMTWEDLADDIGGLIAHLGLAQVDVLGQSLGGGVAFQTAVRHRARVRKLVLVSAPFARDGWFPSALEGFEHLTPAAAEFMKPSPVYQTYARLAPKPDFASLVGKVGELTRREYDWADAVAGLPPALLVVGDADAIRPQHVTDFYAKLGGGLHDPGWDGKGGRSASQLAVLPGVTHYDMHDNLMLAAVAGSFLAK